jgi:exodeoxyribonuclease VII large subunit
MNSLAFHDPAHDPPDVWSVDAITAEIKGIIEPQFVGIWVEGEVVSLRQAASGHVYFSLRGDDAILSAALFRSHARRLSVPLSEGDRVACFGSVEVYARSGRYQLIVRRVRHSGEGALLAQLEELKRRLKNEGLFDESRKRPLPAIPRRIGVITSPTGAAVRDIIRSIHDRFSVPILLAPSSVQGDAAPASMVEALQRLEQVDDVDVIIIGRGGGSLQDLWAFNDERLARAIAACPKPVVSAVGHEIDTMLTDFIADARAATPTHAGALVVPLRTDLSDRLRRLRTNACRGLNNTVVENRNKLDVLQARLADPTRLVRQQWQRMDDLDRRLMRSARSAHQHAVTRIHTLNQRLRMLHPMAQLKREQQSLNDLTARLARSWQSTFERCRARLNTLDVAIDALGPQAAMERGYAIVRRRTDDRVVRILNDVRVGDDIEILLREGAVDAAVTGKRASEDQS